MKVVYEFVVADRADSQLLAQSPVDQLSLPYFRCFGLDPANLGGGQENIFRSLFFKELIYSSSVG